MVLYTAERCAIVHQLVHRAANSIVEMGKLLSLLARDDSTCCSPKSYDVFLDFENAAPTETEREVFDEVDRVLKESEAVLEEIQCYKVT